MKSCYSLYQQKLSITLCSLSALRRSPETFFNKTWSKINESTKCHWKHGTLTDQIRGLQGMVINICRWMHIYTRGVSQSLADSETHAHRYHSNKQNEMWVEPILTMWDTVLLCILFDGNLNNIYMSFMFITIFEEWCHPCAHIKAYIYSPKQRGSLVRFANECRYGLPPQTAFGKYYLNEMVLRFANTLIHLSELCLCWFESLVNKIQMNNICDHFCLGLNVSSQPVWGFVGFCWSVL